MNLTISILNLIEETTRWKKQAMLTHNGTKIYGKPISTKSSLYGQSRLSRDAISKLKQSGIVKSFDDQVSGMNTGTHNIIRKNNVRLNLSTDRINDEPSNYSGMDIERIHIDPRAQQIRLNSEGKRNPIISRHEANESSETRKILRDHPATSFYTAITRFHKNGKLVGMHASEKILQDEKRNRDMMHTLYGNESRNLQASHDRYRKDSGEYSDKIQSTTNKEISKRFSINNISKSEKLDKLLSQSEKNRLADLKNRSERVSKFAFTDDGRIDRAKAQLIRPVRNKIDSEINKIIGDPKYDEVSKVARVNTL